MPRLRALWLNYLTSGTSDPECFLLLKFINSFSLVGIASLLTFGAVHCADGSALVGAVELLLGVAAIANILVLRRTHRAGTASSVILALMLIVLLLLLATGGLYGTGIFWFFTYPALAFFMKGSRAGAWWMTAAFAEIIAAMFLGYGNIYFTPYAAAVLRQMAASLFAVTLLVYFYQSIHEDQDALLKRRTQELIDLGWKKKAYDD